MATIIFYEKPGCGNNTRQKNLLLEAGHELIVHNLLETRWGRDELRAFFGERPVAEWFNRAAPRIKSGEVDPEALDESEAMDMMLADPLLIRRPLMQCGDWREAGFDPERLGAWLIPQNAGEGDPRDLERCTRNHHCPSPGENR